MSADLQVARTCTAAWSLVEDTSGTEHQCRFNEPHVGTLHVCRCGAAIDASAGGIQHLPSVGERCHECGSSHLTWSMQVKFSPDIAEGRHRTNEATARAYLGCDNCSATIRAMSEPDLLAFLNSHRPAAGEPDPTPPKEPLNPCLDN